MSGWCSDTTCALHICCFIIFSTIIETHCTRVSPLAPRPPSGGMCRVPRSPGRPCSLGLHLKIRYFSCTIKRMGTQLNYVWVQLGTNGASEPHKATFFLQPPTKKLDIPHWSQGSQSEKKGKTFLFSGPAKQTIQRGKLYTQNPDTTTGVHHTVSGPQGRSV